MSLFRTTITVIEKNVRSISLILVAATVVFLIVDNSGSAPATSTSGLASTSSSVTLPETVSFNAPVVHKPTKTQTPATATAAVATPTVTPPVVPPVVIPDIALPYSVTNFLTAAPWNALDGTVGTQYSKRFYTTLLDIKATDDNTGFAELAGSEKWANYAFNMKVNFISGTAFSMVARYKDDQNYTVCTFGEDGYARIDNVANGKTTKIVSLQKQIHTIPYVTDIAYAMTVKGNEVRCLVNNQPIIGTISNMQKNGGIGIQVYNDADGTAELKVQGISVTILK